MPKNPSVKPCLPLSTVKPIYPNGSIEPACPLELFDESEISQKLKISRSKLRQDRCRGKGIPFVTIGRSIRYRWQDVECYLNENLQTNTLASTARSFKHA